KDERPSPPAAGPPANEAPADGHARTAQTLRRRVLVGAGVALFCVLGAIAIVVVGRKWAARPEATRAAARQPLVEGPVATYTVEENEAWEALHRARKSDSR